jgi:hypothetical protein
MTDNPLEDTPERTARIRAEAHRLWQHDGGPHGRDLEYWERARELIGIQDSPGAGQVHESMVRNATVDGEPVDEASLQDNLGEFPDRFTDQGDRIETPMTRAKLRKTERGK